MGRVLHPVTDHAQALNFTHGDPWVRWGTPVDPPWRMWRTEHALVAERRGGRRHSLAVIPVPTAPDDHDAVGSAIDAAMQADLFGDLGTPSISVPQHVLGAATQRLSLGDGGNWDWMWTVDQPRPLPAEAALVELDDTADADDLRGLAQNHSPTGEGDPGSGVSERWVGLRDESGDLIAAGSMQRLASGTPHLAGIVVHADHRGRGLGSAVTAALTRIGLADSGVCTLGMYSDNVAARRAYYGLGYATAWAWASRMLIAEEHSSPGGR